MPSVSHEPLIRLFQQTFPGLELPNQEAFMAFLAANELSCLLDKTAECAEPIFVSLTEETLKCVIICVPASANLADEMMQGAYELLEDTQSPIVLYWPQQLLEVDSDRYAAVKRTLTLTPQGREEVLARHMETENLTSSSGETLYWTALRLFLDLCQDAPSYREKYIVNPPITSWEPTERRVNEILRFTYCMYPNLYYAEQSLPIVNMIPWVHDMIDTLSADKRIPPWVRALPMRTALQALRGLAILHLLYEGVNFREGALTRQGYSTLTHIPFIYIAHAISSRLGKKISNQTLGALIFYTVNFLSTGCHQGVSLYMNIPPGTALLHSIIITRYMLQWATIMTQAFITLITRLGLLFFIFKVMGIFERFLPDISDISHNTKNGLHSIVLLTVDLLAIPWLDLDRFKFDRWVRPQMFEEKALLDLAKQCNATAACQLKVETPVSTRLGNQMRSKPFINQQTLHIQAIKPGEIVDCELTIKTPSIPTPDVPLSCRELTLSCRERFFPSFASSERQALVLPPVVVEHPTEIYRTCEEPFK